MVQLFLRARTRSYFKSRSSDRDGGTDRARVAAIAGALDNALLTAEAERSGLSHRVDDVLARAAITMGNESDEYLTRDPRDSALQDQFGMEILKGQQRLKELEATISHFEFLKSALASRFPNLTSPAKEFDGPTAR
jgi:hypothetical protein